MDVSPGNDFYSELFLDLNQPYGESLDCYSMDGQIASGSFEDICDGIDTCANFPVLEEPYYNTILNSCNCSTGDPMEPVGHSALKPTSNNPTTVPPDLSYSDRSQLDGFKDWMTQGSIPVLWTSPYENIATPWTIPTQVEAPPSWTSPPQNYFSTARIPSLLSMKKEPPGLLDVFQTLMGEMHNIRKDIQNGKERLEFFMGQMSGIPEDIQILKERHEKIAQKLGNFSKDVLDRLESVTTS